MHREKKVPQMAFREFVEKAKEGHHRLVDEYAKEGWRLVQIFSPSVSASGGGISDYFELIFERKK